LRQRGGAQPGTPVPYVLRSFRFVSTQFSDVL
jgi:hypothetical protein